MRILPPHSRDRMNKLDIHTWKDICAFTMFLLNSIFETGFVGVGNNHVLITSLNRLEAASRNYSRGQCVVNRFIFIVG